MSEEETYPSLLPFNCRNFSSGPLILIDKLTLYLPHIYTTSEKIRFWLLLNGSKTEQKINDTLRPNSGQSIYLRLSSIDYKTPYNLTVTINNNEEDSTCTQEIRPDLTTTQKMSRRPEYTVTYSFIRINFSFN